MKNKSTISDAELKRQLEYARALKDEDIDTSDPDALILSEEKWAKARPFREMFRPIKVLFSLRVDADVLHYFQQTGEGYQTRMNAALRAQMEREQQKHGLENTASELK